jgi:type VI secretion system protein ImpA
MHALPFHTDALLQPLGDAAPSGPDLEYDPRFAELQLMGAGKPERQYGDKLYPAEAPEWGSVQEQALVLAQETRDLRVAVWLTRSAARTHGLGGAAAGLALVHGLLAQRWEDVHPQLDASDNNDATMRLGALGPLTAPEAVLADLRSATLVPVRGSLSWRELELGLGRAEAFAEETVPTETGVLQALQGLLQEHDSLRATVAQLCAASAGICAVLDERLGSDHHADMTPLTRLVDVLKTAVAQVTGSEQGDPEGAADGAAHGTAQSLLGTSPAGAIGGLVSRADVMRQLDRICEWIERHEPTNPAPILIRRAQRLMNKSFMEIMRDLAPDGVAQIENLAGPEAAS